MADARHEFVTANNVGLVQMRNVAVVNEGQQQRNKRNGIVGLRRSTSSVTTRSEKTAIRPAVTLTKKRSFYRALSGVSFQNSVDPSHVAYKDTFDDDIDGWQMDHGWSRQRLSTAPSKPGPVRVTFVKRSASSQSSHNINGSVSNGYPSDDEAADEDFDYFQTVHSVSNYSKQESPTTPSPSTVIKVNWHEPPTPAHIYDIPNTRVAEEPVADDLSCIDLSIFEPSPPREETLVNVVTVSSGKEAEKVTSLPGFIYRPPRPERRGQTLRDRLKLPLRKLFHAPPPPAVDYCDDSNNSTDPTDRGQNQELTGKTKIDVKNDTCPRESRRNWLSTTPPIGSRLLVAGNRG